jgi:hypothetical protein
MNRLRAFLCLVAAAMLGLTSCALSVSAGFVNDNQLPAANRWIRPDLAIGLPGYYTYEGPQGRPIQFGAPFGQPCKPILVRFENSVPDAPYRSFVEVVHEARAAGVDIAITDRAGDFMPSELYPPGLHLETVQLVAVFADKKAPTGLAFGAPDRTDLGWDAVLAPDGHHEYVTDLNIKLHLSVLGMDATAFRKAALGFVGFTQGVGVSTAPGSALTGKYASAADRFSVQDISAMLAMSGCAAKSPAKGTRA